MHKGTENIFTLWDQYIIDCVPTLNLGHEKSASLMQREQNQAQEAQSELCQREDENNRQNCKNRNILLKQQIK